MKLSKLEKRFIAMAIVFGMILSFMPVTKRTEAAVSTGTVDFLAAVDYDDPQTFSETSKNDKTSGDYTYREDGYGNVIITGYTGKATKVTVPSKIDGKKVVCIYGAFRDNTAITDVVLPETVTRLEYGSFSGATNLVNINIENVKSIRGSSFSGCENLGEIVLPETMIEASFGGAHIKELTISNYLAGQPVSLGYFEVDKLKFKDDIKKIWMHFEIITPEIVIPDSVTDMDHAIFYYRKGKIVVGDGVTRIGMFQFNDVGASYWSDDASETAEVILGKNVKVIDQYAFYESGVTSLVIPDSVTEIQYMAFRRAKHLSDITFSKNLTKVYGGHSGCMVDSLWYNNQKDGVVYTGSALYSYKGSVPDNTTINVKSGTKGIAYAAFQTEDNTGSNITKVTLPKGLLYIGGVSFINTGIKDISIPETVTEIGPGAFTNTNLKSVYIPKSVTKIGSYAFGYTCDDLKDDNYIQINEDGYYLDSEYEEFTNKTSYYEYTWRDYKDYSYTQKSLNAKNEIVSETIDVQEDYMESVCPFRRLENDYFDGKYKPSKVSGFTIKGYRGTAAEKYAKANGFTFEELKDGIYKENGSLVYYRNNTLATNVTEVVKDTLTGKWYNVVKGKVVVGPTAGKNSNGWWYIGKDGTIDFSYSGLVKYSGSWWYVKNGKLNLSYTGLVKHSGTWWYCKSGKVDFSYTGLCQYNGSWWYVAKGQVNFKYTGLCRYNGSWWYVAKGQVNFKYTGLCKYNGIWWYVAKGQVNFKYTGLCKYSGSWWYVKGGQINFGYTGLCQYSGSWWYVEKGKVNFSYNSLCKYSGSWWYIKGGKVNFGYNGTVKYNGKTFKVKNGKVVF